MRFTNHKINSEVNKKLKEMAAQLPPMVKLNKATGEPLVLIRKKSVAWEELTDEQKQQHKKEYHPRQNGQTWDRPVRYFVTYKEPVLINHFVNIMQAYQSKGFDGVETYLKNIESILEASKPLVAEEVLK